MIGTRRAIALAFALACSTACYDPFPDRPAIPFDCERWIAEPGVRGEMADDLIANHLRMGMSKDEVGALLGLDLASVGSLFSEDIGPVASQSDANCCCCHFALQFDENDRLVAFGLDWY